MKVSIELALKTREVNQLFGRKINGGRLFMEAVLQKCHVVVRDSEQWHQIEQALFVLTQQFMEEIQRFQVLMSKKSSLHEKKIYFVTQFYPAITVCNALGIRLIEFIEIYDALIVSIKLLHLMGYVETEHDYYANIRRIQGMTNKMLSKIILINVPIIISQ